MFLLRSLVIALAMYSRIPMPHVEWRKDDMRYAICFFPLVGAVLTALQCLWLRLVGHFGAAWGAGPLLKPLVLFVIPVVMTGGFHLDGFMDACDALSSFLPAERRLAILKDPHIGAFAVIRLLVYCCLVLAALSLFRWGSGALAWGAGFVLSRILSGISVLTFPCAKKEGSLYVFAQGAERRRALAVLCLELVLCLAFMLYCSPLSGLCLAGAAGVVFFYYKVMAVTKFGGITGDLAGWFVCVCELAMTAVQAVLFAAGGN